MHHDDTGAMTSAKAAVSDAKKLAERVLAGELLPAEGCAVIAALCKASDWPPELVPFASLEHEQDGHEKFGFNRVNTAPLILQECRVLLDWKVA
jgi:hypothetical protein